MPTLTSEYIKNKLELIHSPEMTSLKNTEYKKWLVYNGSLLPVLEERIRKEFSRSETVTELLHRIAPLNIMKKIIDKKSTVYAETPIRQAGNEDDDDNALLEKYEDATRFNIRMMEANRMMSMFKKMCCEIYVSRLGIPGLRILPPHTYYAFSSSSVSPDIPDNIWKIVSWDQDPAKQLFSVWTDQQFALVTGVGEIAASRMLELNNADAVNPYGVMPFSYISNSSISIEPVPDDDLYSASIVIPIVLTDLLYGCKYQAFSLIWTVGFPGDIPANPNSVIHVQRDAMGNAPEVNQLSPSVDVAGVLQAVEAIVSYLLSSRGLTTTTLSGRLGVDNAASGISKAIDNADVAEDKKEQQSYFFQLETDIWQRLTQFIVPTWRRQNSLAPAYNMEFSKDFTVALQLQEPKVTMTAMEQVELSKKKIDAGFTTLRRELYTMYPDFNDEEIDKLLSEIEQEKSKSRNYNMGVEPEDVDGQEQPDIQD